MIKTTLKLSALLLLAWLIFFLATLPAKQVIPRLPIDSRQASFHDLSGSIYQGQAATAIFNKMRFSQFAWDIATSKLLTGGFATHISADTAGGNLDLDFASPISALKNSGNKGPAEFNISNAVIQLPLADLPLPPLFKAFPVKAEILADIQQLAVENHFPTDISGDIAVRDLQYKLQNEWLNFGTLKVQPRVEEGLVIANLSSNSQLLTLTGKFTLKNTGQYSIEAFLKPTEKMPQSITGMLKMGTKPQNDGSFLFKYKGKLKL